MRKALVLSFAAHAVGLALAWPVARAVELAEAKDHWSGKTADLPSSEAFDVGVEDSPRAVVSTGSPESVAAQAAPAPPPAPPADGPEPLDLSALAAAGAPSTTKPKSTASAPRRSAAAENGTPRPPAAKSRPGKRASSAEGGESGGPFGAEGTPSPRDLGYAFTRAIPPANDSDLGWAKVAVGEVGRLEVALRVDATGHITSAEPRGTARPGALVTLLRRTIPLLQAGTFEVRRGSVGEGTEILELRAAVSGASEDAASADRLAFEYGRGRGRARFVVPGGPRVEVSLKVLRVEAP